MKPKSCGISPMTNTKKKKFHHFNASWILSEMISLFGNGLMNSSVLCPWKRNCCQPPRPQRKNQKLRTLSKQITADGVKMDHHAMTILFFVIVRFRINKAPVSSGSKQNQTIKKATKKNPPGYCGNTPIYKLYRLFLLMRCFSNLQYCATQLLALNVTNRQLRGATRISFLHLHFCLEY